MKKIYLAFFLILFWSYLADCRNLLYKSHLKPLLIQKDNGNNDKDKNDEKEDSVFCTFLNSYLFFQ